MSLTRVTITGSFERSDGSPQQGTVTAVCSTTIENGGEQVSAAPIAGQLDDEGKLVNAEGGPLQLAANNDEGTEPGGSYYSFTVELSDAPLVFFTAVVPHDAPEVEGHPTIDITTLET